MDKQEERKLLNTLKSIDGTLKRIEQSLTAEKQHEVVKEAVSHALLGDKKCKCDCGKSPLSGI